MALFKLTGSFVLARLQQAQTKLAKSRHMTRMSHYTAACVVRASANLWCATRDARAYFRRFELHNAPLIAAIIVCACANQRSHNALSRNNILHCSHQAITAQLGHSGEIGTRGGEAPEDGIVAALAVPLPRATLLAI